MSYDIALHDPVSKEIIEVHDKHYMRGGTYKLGGNNELTLNITYNYSKYFINTIDEKKGIRKIYGMTGSDSIPVLEKAINQLGDNVSSNYWEATEGNAKRALLQLVALAKIRPDGIWDGD